MSNYVKEEILLEEVPNLDLLKNEIKIEEGLDIDIVIKEEEETRVPHSELKTESADSSHYSEEYRDKGRFACEVCGKELSSNRRLNQHLKWHSKEKNHKCSECEYSSKTKPGLMRHIRLRHPTETPFPCEVCSKSFSTTKLLKIHSASHNEEKPYKCDRCSIACKWKKNLAKHKAMVHDNGGRFTCEVCGKKFLYKAHIKVHMERHGMRRNHKCGDCGYTAKAKVDLARHIRLRHPTETLFQCEVCSKSFSILSLVKGHFLKHDQCSVALDRHRVKLSSEVCGNKLLLQANFDQRSIGHNDETEESGDGFDNKTSLTRQMLAQEIVKESRKESISSTNNEEHSSNSWFSRGDLMKNETTIEECGLKSVIKSESVMNEELEELINVEIKSEPREIEDP